MKVMALALKCCVMLLVVAALVLGGVAVAQVVTTAPVQARGGSGDPALDRHKRIVELLGQAHDDLASNRDPEVIKQKCFQVLALDPDNTQARLYLLQAERLRPKESLAKETTPSSPAEETKSLELKARSRPTTPAAVLSADQTASRRPRPARAVVSGKDAQAAPKPVLTWQPSGFMLWGAAALLLTAVVLVMMIALDRLLAPKRRRLVQSRLVEQMRKATAQSFEGLGGDSVLVEPQQRDFSADVSAGQGVAGAAAARPSLLLTARTDASEVKRGKIESEQPIGPPDAASAAERATEPARPTEQPIVPPWGIEFGEMRVEPFADVPLSQASLPEAEFQAPIGPPLLDSGNGGQIPVNGIQIQTPLIEDSQASEESGPTLRGQSDRSSLLE